MPKINAMWNPSDMNGTMTLSNGNLTIVSAIAATGAGNIRASHGKTSGKWYWELKLDAGATTLFAGIASKSYQITSTEYLGTSSDALKIKAYYGNNGNKLPENVPYGTAIAVGNIVGVALNLDAGTLEFYKNGVSMGLSHTNLQGMGEVFPFFKSMGTVSRTITANFGATSFAYPIPFGFKAFNDATVNKFLISSEDKVYSDSTNIVDKIMTPIMTTNTSPSGVASASSTQTGYEAWRVFDRDVASQSTWRSASNTTANSWIRYEFPTPQVINKYTLRCWKQLAQSPSSWTFQGSNDTLTWNILDTKSSITGWDVNESLSVDMENSIPFKYYQIVFTAAISGIYYIITDLELIYSIKNKILINIDGISELDFIKRGMNKSHFLDFNDVYESMNYEKKESNILGSGKVFTQKIDTTKIPIKKASIT
ncbi:SPRY domain-containing protein [Paenibacillus xylanexedens]|uniref:SPRY domain-containing protein n=1 Tax=Paenibacillus xylanexedens TaxID=528191 RepID=UPI003D072DE3